MYNIRTRLPLYEILLCIYSIIVACNEFAAKHTNNLIISINYVDCNSCVSFIRHTLIYIRYYIIVFVSSASRVKHNYAGFDGRGARGVINGRYRNAVYYFIPTGILFSE